MSDEIELYEIDGEILTVEVVAMQPLLAPPKPIRTAVETLADIIDQYVQNEIDAHYRIISSWTYRPDALRKVASKYRSAAKYLGIQNVKLRVLDPTKFGHKLISQRISKTSNEYRGHGNWSFWVDLSQVDPAAATEALARYADFEEARSVQHDFGDVSLRSEPSTFQKVQQEERAQIMQSMKDAL